MYKELCVSAKIEERRLCELKKRQDYVKHSAHPSESRRSSNRPNPNAEPAKQVKSFSRRCHNCGKPGHFTRD